MEKYCFKLRSKPPFKLLYTVSILRRSIRNEIDRWIADSYRRVVIFDMEPHALTVKQVGTECEPRLSVTVLARHLVSDVEARVTALLERIMGLVLDISEFYSQIKDSPQLLTLAEPFIGMRPTKFITDHEALVSAIACQQVSLSLGITLLNRLAVTYGEWVIVSGKRVYAFPRPERLAELKPGDFRKLGFSLRKGSTILELSRAVTSRSLRLSELVNMDDALVRDELYSIKGVGPWTVDYYLLRCLGRLHIFPRNDSGALNSLISWLHLKDKPNQEMLNRILAPISPYAGMIYFHLLLKKLYIYG